MCWNKQTQANDFENFKLGQKLKIQSETVKTLGLSVKSSLNYFRLWVTTTGVDEDEH